MKERSTQGTASRRTIGGGEPRGLATVEAEGMRRMPSQVYILLSAAQRPIRTTETFASSIRKTLQGAE